jgi:hypothetical protein
MTLTEGQLRQIVEDASRMVIQEMLGDRFPFRGMNARTLNNVGRLTDSLGRISRNAAKNASAYKLNNLLNFTPSTSARKPDNLLNFMPNGDAYNGFNGMAYNYGPGMYFPNGFYQGY